MREKPVEALYVRELVSNPCYVTKRGTLVAETGLSHHLLQFLPARRGRELDSGRSVRPSVRHKPVSYRNGRTD